MNILSRIIQKLLPTEEGFYGTLAELAAISKHSTLSLQQFVEKATQGEFDSELAQQIASDRAQAKAMCDKFSQDLGRSFITPFDREDMLEFANVLNRNIKLTDKIKTRMQRSQLIERGGDFSAMLKIMQEQVAILQEVVKQLNSNKMEETQKAAAKLNDLEREADELLEHLIENLCNDNLSMQEAFVRKDIYEMFERLSDAYRDAGNAAVQIVLKHN